MIRTLTFALRRDPDTSRAIGYHATQQNLAYNHAYNHAVDMLNQEPNLPKRSGKNHPDALNKRITVWRQTHRQKDDAPFSVPEPTPIAELVIQSPEDIIGADRGAKNHLAVSSGHRAHHQGSGRRRNKKRQHQRHIAGKPRNSKRRQHTIAKQRERGRRYVQRRDQDLRQQIRNILLEAQPKLIAVESLHPISMMASARGTVEHPGQNTKAKRRLNESLAESAIGHVGELLREAAAKLGIPTVSVPLQGTSQTCRAAETGARITARAQRCSSAGNAVPTPTPTGLPPSSSATGRTPGTANGGRVIPRTY